MTSAQLEERVQAALKIIKLATQFTSPDMNELQCVVCGAGASFPGSAHASRHTAECPLGQIRAALCDKGPL